MKRSSKTILAAIIVAVGLLMGSAGFILASWWNAVRAFADLDWRDRATPAEEKAMAERVLALPYSDAVHDAALTLCRVGDAGSIPRLLGALKAQPDTSKGGAMICTKMHCLDALRRITGHNAGSNYADWAKWWDEIGSKLPPEAFPLRSQEASP